MSIDSYAPKVGDEVFSYNHHWSERTISGHGTVTRVTKTRAIVTAKNGKETRWVLRNGDAVKLEGASEFRSDFLRPITDPRYADILRATEYRNLTGRALESVEDFRRAGRTTEAAADVVKAFQALVDLGHGE